MDCSFGLHDACEYAVEVFAGLFDVFCVSAEVYFACLEQVAALPFVADADGYDVQFCQCFQGFLWTAHAEHFDDALVGLVESVLGASVSLRDPDALVFLCDAISDVF